jgi:hypothetical protein
LCASIFVDIFQPHRTIRGVVLLLTAPFVMPIAFAQSSAASSTSIEISSQLVAAASEAILTLPDSPGTVSTSSAGEVSSRAAGFGAFQNVPPDNGPIATRLDKYIKPGQIAPSLTVNDKVLLGIKDAVSPLSAVGWVLSAGYEHVTNGSPNYGTNGKAFLQRLGASAARDSSEDIFTDSIMSSVLREDPRYYKLGAGHNIIHRAFYAATRTLVTRTDGGRATVNLAFLSGNLAGSALTQAYYPPVNRGFKEVAETFGGSVGGSALGFLASEFLDDVLQSVHLERSK